MSDQAKSSARNIIIGAVVIVVILGAVIWYFFSYKPEQEAIEKARQEQLAKEAADQKRKEAEEQKKTRYDQLISDADAAFNQGNWSQAQSRYSEALGLFANEQYPQSQLALVNAELEAIAAKEAKKAAGIIERVTDRNGRYYVIVSSSIDEDLAMDYATKLSQEGNDVKIVPHELKELAYYGVSIGDYATWDQASQAARSSANFESGAWVLKN